MHLYTTLDGRGARNPVKDTPRFPEPSPAPLALDYATIDTIFKKIPKSREKAWLMTIAYVGLPNAVINELEPSGFDAEAATLAVPGRKKGQGSRGRVLPLTPGGVKAMKMMQATNAWKAGISRFVLRRVLHAACEAADVPLIHPYALRHSFGTEVYRSSGDIRATQVLMLHSTPTLTHRHTLAAVDTRVAAALKGFGKKR